MNRDAQFVAAQIGKTSNWLKRNAQHLPHHRAGRTIFWTDEDVAAMVDQFKVRPAVKAGKPPTGPIPLGTRRRRAS